MVSDLILAGVPVCRYNDVWSRGTGSGTGSGGLGCAGAFYQNLSRGVGNGHGMCQGLGDHTHKYGWGMGVDFTAPGKELFKLSLFPAEQLPILMCLLEAKEDKENGD